MTASAPFDLLNDIAQRSKAFAEGLPAQEEAVELWSGIGFTLAGQHYVAAMGEISEILPIPRYTQIPGVRNWLLGAANVRGRLLPIMDLAQFFGLNRSTSSNRDRRILIIERGDLLSALVVDSVQGMQYFASDSFQKVVDDVPSKIAPFIKGAFIKNEESWRVFNTFDLAESERFLNVAQR